MTPMPPTHFFAEDLADHIVVMEGAVALMVYFASLERQRVHGQMTRVQ